MLNRKTFNLGYTIVFSKINRVVAASLTDSACEICQLVENCLRNQPESFTYSESYYFLYKITNVLLILGDTRTQRTTSKTLK